MGCIQDCELKSKTLNNSIPFSMQGKIVRAKVVSVYDGDTITLVFKFGNVFCHHACRLEGLDCAEIKTKNQEEKKVGLEAKEYLTNLLVNQLVTVTFSDKNDKFGRLLGKIEFNGMNISDHMIEKGFGYAYNGEKKKKFEDWKLT